MPADPTLPSEEELARAAHAAFYASTEHNGVRVGSTPFDELHPMWRRAWVAAARAVLTQALTGAKP